MNDMTNEELLDLIGELAGEDPPNQDEMGGCVFCSGRRPGERYGYADRYLSDHTEECPWVKARAVLGDNLPTARHVASPEPMTLQQADEEDAYDSYDIDGQSD